jgi:hypothetical protein
VAKVEDGNLAALQGFDARALAELVDGRGGKACLVRLYFSNRNMRVAGGVVDVMNNGVGLTPASISMPLGFYASGSRK